MVRARALYIHRHAPPTLPATWIQRPHISKHVFRRVRTAQLRTSCTLHFHPRTPPALRTPPPVYAPQQHTCTALISHPSSMQSLAADRSSARPSSPRPIDMRAGRTRGAATSRAPANDDTHTAGAARTGDSAAAEVPTKAYMAGGGQGGRGTGEGGRGRGVERAAVMRGQGEWGMRLLVCRGGGGAGTDAVGGWRGWSTVGAETATPIRERGGAGGGGSARRAGPPPRAPPHPLAMRSHLGECVVSSGARAATSLRWRPTGGRPAGHRGGGRGVLAISVSASHPGWGGDRQRAEKNVTVSPVIFIP